MYHQRISQAINMCEQHISTIDDNNVIKSEIESYFVSALVTLIVSEYEEHLESVFLMRAQQCGDRMAINFIKKALDQKFRSPDLGKINSMLQMFDVALRDDFKREIENSQHHAAWDSIMKARHAVVHKKGSINITFRELMINYSLTLVIIENVERILFPSPVTP